MQENIYKKIKKDVYTVAGIGLASIFLTTGAFAQKGTIDDTVNTVESSKPGISDAIKEEQKSLDDISNEINKSFQENLANYIEIGGKPAYKETIKGQEYYFVEDLDYALLKIKLKSNTSLNYLAIVRYAIEQGFKEAVSAMDYSQREANFLLKSIEKDGKDIYAYIKTNINGTKLSAQNKEE